MTTPEDRMTEVDPHAGARQAGAWRRALRGFQDFIARGSAVELAVGIVIGAAFGAVVTAVTTGFLGPLIALVFGGTDLTGLANVHVWRANFQFGLILQALVNFLLTAAALYFLVISPLNTLAARRARGKADATATPPAPPEDVQLLRQIRDLLAEQGRAAVLPSGKTQPPAPPHQ